MTTEEDLSKQGHQKAVSGCLTATHPSFPYWHLLANRCGRILPKHYTPTAV